MMISHNTFDSFFRSPFGALPVGSVVCLRVSVKNDQKPDLVDLRCWDGKEHKWPMRLLGVHKGLYLYEAEITVSHEPCLFWYRFEVFLEGKREVLGAPFGGNGCGEGAQGSEESFQITVYDPDYTTPEWMHHGVIYQIMVDRFYHGKGTDALLTAKGPDTVLHKDWYDLPNMVVSQNNDNLANDFFGGNLEGVRQKLPYLRDLGVSVIYFNPVFLSRSNHKYNTNDYSCIDPMFGDRATLTRLCEEARSMGIHIMLDGVFSHVGDDSPYFNRQGTYGKHTGAYRDPNSPFRSWFTFHHWPDDYDCWWGFKTLPNIVEDNEAYRKYILNAPDAIIKTWLRAGADGWRLDVADELPMSFLREMRQEVKKTKPDAAILGEVWEDASHKVAYGELRSYVLGDTLDSVMNYPLRDLLISFLLGTQSAEAVAHDLTCMLQNYPVPFLYSLMNLMGSHDRPRILNVLAGRDGNDVPRFERADVVLTQEERMIGSLREHLMFRYIVSMPGMPGIYYADEVGLEGCADPYCRRTYPWGREDLNMLQAYKDLLKMHNTHLVLQTGYCRCWAACKDVLGVTRHIDTQDVFGAPAESATAITLINRSASPVEIFLTGDDVKGIPFLYTEQGMEIAPTGVGFRVHLGGLRGLTLFSRT